MTINLDTKQTTMTDINSNAEIEAEAEIAAATKAAASVVDGEVSGLGPSDAVLHLTFHPSTPKAQYNTAICTDEGEKKLVLMYFAIQGLGEVPRLILAEAAMPYESFAPFGGEDQSVAMEWRSRSPNGLLPTLSGAGIPRASPISQSSAIIRFLAKRLGMDGGKDDVVASTRADILFETAKDLGGDGKKELIASVLADPEKDYSVAKGPFSTGKRIEKMLATMADPKDESAALNYGQIQLFHVLLQCEGRRKGCVLDNLGVVLDDFRIQMENRAGLKEYLNSTARFPFIKKELGEDGGYTYSTGPLKRSEIKSPT